MEHWQSLATLGLVAVAVVGLGWAAAWYTLRIRQLELAGFGADVRAANLLGRTLAGGWMSAKGVQEVMAAFNALDPHKGAALALAVQGLVSKTDHNNAMDMKYLESKVVALVRTFRRAAIEDVQPEGSADVSRPREQGGPSYHVKPM